MNTKLAGLCAGLALMAVGTVQAAMISYTGSEWLHDGGSEASDYLLSVDDNTAGFFTFNVKVTTAALGTNPDTDLLAVFFDSEGMFNSGSTAIVGPDVTGVYFDTLACGGGCNLNGLTSDAFDVVVRIGSSGSPYINSTSFTLAAVSGASLDNFTRFGIRAQSTGTDGEGSDKAITFSRNVTVPEPGTLALLGMGLIGVVATRRRARASK